MADHPPLGAESADSCHSLNIFVDIDYITNSRDAAIVVTCHDIKFHNMIYNIACFRS